MGSVTAVSGGIMADALNGMDTGRADSMSDWISVKERLPEELPENKGRKTISCLVALKSCYPKGKATIQKRQRQWIPYYDGSFVGWEWSTKSHPLDAPPRPAEGGIALERVQG